ncbi:metal-dependent hydrolase [Fusibacter bizertensis]|uniref:Metal-dependent hydrolase n=1 Tax=Fusibacter bizertensis TaxID=1488331 RepID=A0ABT6ND37_9FIRM|nr:metal-dependent hydrolase [Fusibacter bizertensis]MDH8678338.1 metal-dependent hydrolase [Fusibacter bizertensis]
MDPLTHGLVGVAISAFSGTAVSIDNPLTIGAMLGAMSPDLDFVIRLFKDDAAYLEHHRGLSHSIPFLVGFSTIITIMLSQMGFVGFNFLTTLLWTFIGALSHTGLDILNSYGAKLFRKKRKANILTLYDPVISIVGICLIINGTNTMYELITGVLIIGIYLLMRNISRHNALVTLESYFSKQYKQTDVFVMPSLKAFYKWDFVAHTETHNIVGQFNPWWLMAKTEKRIKIQHMMELVDTTYYDLFKSTAVGEIFTRFSPNLHINVTRDELNNQYILRATDLRYFVKKSFMHHATLVLDQDMQFISSYLHPYNINKAIPIYQ